MRRSASEIIRNLERRIARLEKQSEYKSDYITSNHPGMIRVETVFYPTRVAVEKGRMDVELYFETEDKDQAQRFARHFKSWGKKAWSTGGFEVKANIKPSRGMISVSVLLLDIYESFTPIQRRTALSGGLEYMREVLKDEVKKVDTNLYTILVERDFNTRTRVARLERKASPHGQVPDSEFLAMLVRKFQDSRFVSKLELSPRADLDKATSSSSPVFVGSGLTAKRGLIGIYASRKGITFDIDGKGYVYDGEGASFDAKFTYSDHFVTEKALFGRFSESVEKEGFDLI